MCILYTPCSFRKYTGTSDEKKNRPYGLIIIIFKPARPCILAAAAVHLITKRAVHDVLFRVCMCSVYELLYTGCLALFIVCGLTFDIRLQP